MQCDLYATVTVWALTGMDVKFGTTQWRMRIVRIDLIECGRSRKCRRKFIT